MQEKVIFDLFLHLFRAKGTLKTTCELKFGNLAVHHHRKIDTATLAQLNHWISKAKTARSIDEVFD